CKCGGRCQILPTIRECVCCREVTVVDAKCLEAVFEFGLEERLQCITQHSGFQCVSLNKFVLQTAWFQYRQQYDTPFDGPDHERYRHTAYRQLARWCWGFLGKSVRVVLPACAVSCIRAHFPPPGPEENAVYMGHQY
ncbi:uncharacterized protein LOC102806348, partial [Saccoglossus kowalevskii]|uniref:Uncharacterized protein LOC102806348 n=1 Tax=Saccoglossus kowalevskii TaxID=10224 RepID=A0ABM0MX56_SACKO